MDAEMLITLSELFDSYKSSVRLVTRDWRRLICCLSYVGCADWEAGRRG